MFHKPVQKMKVKISNLENLSTKLESDFLIEISLFFFLDVLFIDKNAFPIYNNVDARVYKENIAFLRIRKVTRQSRR